MLKLMSFMVSLLIVLSFVIFHKTNVYNKINTEENRKTTACNLPFVIHKDILCKDEIDTILDLVTSKYVESEVISGKDLAVRKSQQAWIDYGEHEITDKLIHQACKIFQKPTTHAESVQIVKYNAGEFYKPHHDSCCDNTENCVTFREKSGERIGTFLVYLSDDFSDGGTSFPNVGITIKPNIGSGISWQTLGCPFEALHGGADVSSGTKIIANVWIRERPFV